MKLRNKNPELKGLIESMHKKGLEKKSPLLKSLAKSLNRPRRGLSEVNLTRIEKYSGPQDTVVVPGNVLGIGEITKPVNVVALRFSGGAKKKIEKSGGTCLTFHELMEKVPKNVKIIG